jgi:hypothetical protein
VAHSDTTGQGTDDHHAQQHAIDGADHTGTLDHADLSAVGDDDHHNKSHAHNGLDGSGTVAHTHITGQTANDHHNQVHAIDGADHTGTLDHADLSSVTSDQHHAEDHAARHQNGGADEVATATPAANAIPKADGTGDLDAGWIPDGGDATAIHDNEANEISAITEKTNPQDTDLIIIEDSKTSYVKKKAQLGNLGAGYSDVDATSTTSTTSNSDTTINSMTITPGAGTYVVLFTAQIEFDEDDPGYFSVYHNSVQVTASEMQFEKVPEKDKEFPLSMHAVASVADGQAIEIKWRTTSSKTIYCYNRRMTLIRVV